MHERIRDILLGVWGRTVASRPRTVLALCLLIAGGSVYLTATRLEFKADRSTLVDPDKPWNRKFAEYKRNFPHFEDITVVLEGEPGDAAVDELASEE